MQPYLNLGFHILDGVASLDFECDRLPREGLDKDLHAALATGTVPNKLKK